MVPRRLRTGFRADDDGDEQGSETLVRVGALMRLFAEDAARVAGHCALACDRRVVSADDMHDALKYVARTFFERSDLDVRFPTALHEARADLDDASDAEHESSASDAESDAADSNPDPPVPTALAEEALLSREVKRRVDRAVCEWDAWEPTDPAERLVRQAIEKAESRRRSTSVA